ncbi:MAG: FHA domain-containing protein [Myxococcaceae bacterium]
MSESLTTYVTRFLDDPVALERSLRAPVLLYEPPDDEDNEPSISQRRFKTMSGVGGPILGSGEPLILRVRKEKDNAFQRGVTIGRTSNNDVVIDDASVSRFHAWFQVDDAGQWSVLDAGSKNGTHIAGTRLKPKRAAPLPRDTRIRFGQVEVTFLPPKAFLNLLKKRTGR